MRLAARWTVPAFALLLAVPPTGPVAGAIVAKTVTPLNYIVPVTAGSVEDANLRPAMPPSLTISDGTSMPLPLSHWRGQVLLLNFWATWCVPCVKEMTFLDRLQGDLKGMPILVMPISEDRGGIATAKPWLVRQKLTFLRPFADPGAVAANMLNVQGIPTSFIVDKKGRLVQRVQGPFEWDSPPIVDRLKELLAEAP